MQEGPPSPGPRPRRSRWWPMFTGHSEVPYVPAPWVLKIPIPGTARVHYAPRRQPPTCTRKMQQYCKSDTYPMPPPSAVHGSQAIWRCLHDRGLSSPTPPPREPSLAQGLPRRATRSKNVQISLGTDRGKGLDCRDKNSLSSNTIRPHHSNLFFLDKQVIP